MAVNKRSYSIITIVILCIVIVTILSLYQMTLQSIKTITNINRESSPSSNLPPLSIEPSIPTINNNNNEEQNKEENKEDIPLINNYQQESNQNGIDYNDIKEPILYKPNLRQPSSSFSSSSSSSSSSSWLSSFLSKENDFNFNFNNQNNNNNNNNNNFNQNDNQRKLHAVTYASHGGRDDRFCRAVESAVRHEIPLIILGWGVPWTGLAQKLDAAMLYASRIPKDDIIMFTDAFDVMFTNPPSHILEEYNKMNSDLIFAGECGCWPHVIIDHGKACFDDYPQSPTPYRYLNSGTWIGKAESARDMLQAVIKEAGNDFANANDQKLVADMFIGKRFNIQLDYYANLFQSMHMTFDRPLPYCHPYEDIQVVQDGRFYNKRTKTYPSVFHFNGGGKTHHLEMESKLWYKKDSKYNTREENNKLANTLISVPIDDDYDRTISFRRLCPGYFK